MKTIKLVLLLGLPLFSLSAMAECKKWKLTPYGRYIHFQTGLLVKNEEQVPLFVYGGSDMLPHYSITKGQYAVSNQSMECMEWDDTPVKLLKELNEKLDRQNNIQTKLNDTLDKYHQTMTRNLLDKKVDRDQLEVLKEIVIELKKSSK